MGRKNAKVTTDGNEQPAKAKAGNAESTAASKLIARAVALGQKVVSIRDEAQQLILDTGWHAMQYGNCKPMTAVITNVVGMDRKGMIKLMAAAFGVKAEKDSETKEERIIAGDEFANKRAAYEKDKIAFTKEVRKLGNYWTFAPDKAFEGLDLFVLLDAACAKVERAAKDDKKKDKVKHADKVAKARKLIAILKDDEAETTDDEGGDDGDDPSNTVPVADKQGAPAGATLQ